MIELTRSIRHWFAIGLVATFLAGCGAGFLPMPSPDSFETWSRTPLAPDPQMAKLALEQSSCRGGLDAAVPLTIVLQDRRTSSTAAFFLTAPGHFGSCLISAGGAGGGSSTNVIPALRGVITVDEQGSGTAGAVTSVTLGGLVTPDVAAVRIDLDDGQQVQASVGNGYWLAWWPGVAAGVRVAALDGAGVIVGVLDRMGDDWVARGASR